MSECAQVVLLVAYSLFLPQVVVRSATAQYFIFYFMFFGFLAVGMSFFPVYCRDLGFSPFEVSLISAAASIAPITAPPVLAHLAHTRLSPRTVVLSAAVLTMLSFSALFFVQSFIAVFAAWLICLWFYWGMLPLIETRILRADLAGDLKFGHTRIGGSIGFILVMLMLGELVTLQDSAVVLPVGLATLFAICGVTAWLLPRLSSTAAHSDHSPRLPGPSFWRTQAARPIILVLIVYAFVSASHGGYYTYFSLHLDALGFSPRFISQAWIFGVIAEVLMFIGFFRLERRFALPTLLSASIGLSILRWIMLSISANAGIILLSQLLHAFSFAGCHNAALKLIHRALPDSMRDRGQAAMTAFGGGTGGLVGRLLAGALAQSGGSYMQVFLLAAFLAGIGLCISLRLRK